MSEEPTDKDWWEEEAQAVIANLRADLAEARKARDDWQDQYNKQVRRTDELIAKGHWTEVAESKLAAAQERIKTLVIYGDSASELLGREAGKVIALRVEVARLAAGLRYIYVRNYTGAASVAQDVLGGKDLPDDEYRVAVQRDS